MKTKINYDTSENQRIKEKFVSREVYMNMNGLIDDCHYEEFENLYQHIAEKSDSCETCQEKRADLNYDGLCADCGEWEAQEIFEFWAVSDFLYQKLEKHGEPVAEINDTYIWGRTTTGQSIMMDYVIGKICEEMEILEGQKHDWSK